jgi:hypothetical protein
VKPVIAFPPAFLEAVTHGEIVQTRRPKNSSSALFLKPNAVLSVKGISQKLYVEHVWVEFLQDITMESLHREGFWSKQVFIYKWDSLYKTEGSRWRDNPLGVVASFSLEGG